MRRTGIAGRLFSERNLYAMGKIIGIDLGTTNSLAAYYTDQGPKIIPNRLGKNLTPSVVSIDENDQIYVGETAKERMLLAPESTAAVPSTRNRILL